MTGGRQFHPGLTRRPSAGIRLKVILLDEGVNITVQKCLQSGPRLSRLDLSGFWRLPCRLLAESDS